MQSLQLLKGLFCNFLVSAGLRFESLSGSGLTECAAGGRDSYCGRIVCANDV